MLATPCAMSSVFGLWRSPPSRSATTADNRDSIAPSIATVTAGDSRSRIRLGRNAGTANCGSPAGISPKREPTVSTWRPSASEATVPPNRATM